MNDKGQWRRKPDLIFQYGYFYAQQIIIFQIGLIFATTAPLVTFAGVVFFAVRHFVDSYLIIIVHRKEMDSKHQMYKEIIMFVIIALTIYQSCMLAYFYFNDCSYQSIIMGIALAITLMILITNIEEVYDPI